MVVGFSTGSLALHNFRLGLKMVRGQPASAIELSALREDELPPLITELESLNLRQFSYVSVHAPSALYKLTEAELLDALHPVVDRRWPIVVHPDVITDFAKWRKLGDLVCIENMDKRKRVGRTASELAPFFRELPNARLCFDIGHARQIDPTMCEAGLILDSFASRMRQIHLSLVNSSSVHEPLNYESILAYRRVAHLIPRDVPIILETPVGVERIAAELSKVALVLR